MYYKIEEISTDKKSEHTFVLVDFWLSRAASARGEIPVLTNDFLMQLRPVGERIVTNARGWLKRKDNGKFVDPKTLRFDVPEPEWAREKYDRGLPDEIRANIGAYWERAQVRGDIGNKTDPRIARDARDPHGILAKPEVKALLNVGVERP